MIEFRRFFLLNKRLYKQLTYVILLLIIPVAVFLLKVSTKTGGNVMKIALVSEAGEDEYAELLVRELLTIREEFGFITYDSREDAIEAVTRASVDEAWIIPDNLSDAFLRMADGKNPKNPIEIYIREEGVTHLMMQEILESYAFKVFSPEVYFSFMRENYGEESINGMNIEDIYRKVPNSSLFKYSYLDGSSDTETGYLLAPIRGFLAVLLIITSLAASIYYIEDEKNGLFIYWHSKVKNLRTLGYYAVVMMNSSVLVLLSLFLAGIGGSFLREFLLLLMYDYSLIIFSVLVRNIFVRVKTIGVVMPLIVILSLLLSPIFIDLKSMRPIQIFIPSFHYLMSIHNDRSIYNLMMYCFFETILLEIVVFCKRNGLK